MSQCRSECQGRVINVGESPLDDSVAGIKE